MSLTHKAPNRHSGTRLVPGRAFASALVVAATTLVAPALAHAGTASDVGAAHPTSSDAVTRSYWTPARLRAAHQAPTPRVVTTPLGAGLAGAAPQDGSAGSTSAHQSATATVKYKDGWAVGKHYDPRVGKLYFRNPSGQAMVCSGTMVGRNLVMTAGHCVYTGSAGRVGAGWNSRFLFVPGKVGSKNPYGTFTGKDAAAYKAYYQGVGAYAPMPGLDYAFIKLNPHNGQSAGNLVGWDGITWGNYTAYRSIGYPAEGWFAAHGGGNYPWFTHSNRIGSYEWGTTGYYDVRIHNRANGGASGGPWLVSIEGGEYVNSVNSLCTRGPAPNRLCTYMDGPFLTSAVKPLMAFAKNL
jgi:V8-like Glu-specific endopeptidase